MKILLLSFYFRPDLSAGSFRSTALLEALRARAPSGVGIDVLTTLPNRYQSFSRVAPEVEQFDRGTIHRIALPPHASDMSGQARAFLHFARRARALAAQRHYDIVFATSGRLMSAALGAWIARGQGARLYLDIRDIFVDTIGDVLPGRKAGLARAVFARVEGWTMRRADRINLVSPGFEEYFRQRYGERSFSGFTNGIDDEFLPHDPPGLTMHKPPGLPTMLYAGNIGEGQALHEIIPKLATALRSQARLVVIGDGGRRRALEAALAAAGADNVELRAPLPREELLRAYQAADVLFLHLGRQRAFEKVLPSKVFEYAALGKPVLAGVGGYAARFIRAEVDNAAVFPPCDVQAAVTAWQSLKIADQPRPQFIAKFRRSSIALAMADDILSLAPTMDSDR